METENQKITMTFRISKGLKLKLKLYCIENGLEMGEVISELILNKLKNLSK